MNAGQMRTLHEEAQKRGLVYYFGRQMRFSPAMQAAKNLMKERRLGEVYFAETMWMRSRGTPDGVDGWFTDSSLLGNALTGSSHPNSHHLAPHHHTFVPLAT